MWNDIQIAYAEKLHILTYVKFPHRQLLLPDGSLILPVIPDRIIVEQYAGADVPATPFYGGVQHTSAQTAENMVKIIRNAIKCNKCGDVIESFFVSAFLD